MRAIGKRTISFGLVSVPVKIHAATEDHDVALHQVHDEDGGRIRYERRCETCGKVVPYSRIDRAWEEDGQRVVLDDDDLESLPEVSKEEIEVLEFVPAAQVDPIAFERTYYLEPERQGVKPYVLLRRTLERTDRTAIVRFALRTRSSLGALRVRGDVLVLQSLRWADELREADFAALERSPRIAAKEQALADDLVASLHADFHPEQYRDEAQEELRALIARKLESGGAMEVEDEAPTESDGDGEVIDLMEALRRSVERTRSGRTSKAGGKAKPGSTANAPSSTKRAAKRKPATAKKKAAG